MLDRAELAAIREACPITLILEEQLQLRRVGKDWKALCVFHPDRNPSMTVFDQGKRFKCFVCGTSGDVFGLVQHIFGVGFMTAVEMVRSGYLPSVPMPRPEPARQPDRTAEALAIWEMSSPLAGTLGETYFVSRGLKPPFPDDLRFVRLPLGNMGPMPCVVAAVRDLPSKITGLQRIFLRSDGRGKADLPKPKLSLGKIAGSAIRFGDLDGRDTILVCEGPEDGLSLLEMADGLPVWVSLGASFMPAMQFPPQVRRIIIAADNDPAGEKFARKAADAFADRGLAVEIIRPPVGCKDFNDQLRKYPND